MIHDTYRELQRRMGEVIDLRAAKSLLQWDQEVMMPPKGARARGDQLATLAALEHRLFTSDEVDVLLSKLEDAGDALEPDARLLVAETRYRYNRARALPEDFVHRLAEAQSRAYEAWVPARTASDFPAFAPHLETIVSLAREQADYLGFDGSPYDALLEDYERGTTAKGLRALFGDLGPKQGALVARIMDSPNQPDTGWTDQTWNPKKQWELTIRVLRDMGYDFEAGRQDKSVHPFSTNFDSCDVRITTRVDPCDLFSALTGSMHEGGHALYEQGFRPEDRRSFIAEAPGLGIHESQSRMWENFIGRSLAFWEHYLPQLQELYPGQLDGRTPEDCYRAINCVSPSFIRVEADECTYNLHVILRFEIEVDLIEGRLQVSDVPAAWNEKVKQYLGLEVRDDAHGCLQDIHWSHASIGYFPTYALGNLYAAQLFEKIEADVPALWNQVREGDFSALLGWLREKVHRVGHRKLGPAIIESATGRAPDSGAFLRYLEKKYGALYGI